MVGWFCRHRWEIIEDSDMPPGFAQFIDAIRKAGKENLRIVMCKKCGTLKVVK